MMCSPMKRACETASAISELLGARVELNSNLCEVGGLYKANKVRTRFCRSASRGPHLRDSHPKRFRRRGSWPAGRSGLHISRLW